MCEELGLGEEDGRIALLGRLPRVNAKEASKKELVGTFGRDVALLQESNAEADSMIDVVGLI